MLFWCGAAVVLLGDAIADAEPAPPSAAAPAIEAQRMIDQAQAKWRELPGYRALSHKSDGKGAITTTTISVRREVGVAPLVRVEKMIARGQRTAKTRLVLIQNHDGGWKVEDEQPDAKKGAPRAVRLGAMPPLERVLPSRLGTARALGLESPVEYTIEPGVEWFGYRCTRVRAALPAEGVAKVRQRLAEGNGVFGPGVPSGGSPRSADEEKGVGNEDESENKNDEEGAALPPRPAGAGREDRQKTRAAPPPMSEAGMARARAKRQAIALPAAYVYLIDEAAGVIVSWQSIGANGEVVAEVSYQEFRIADDLPDELFVLPAGCTIVEEGDTPAAEKPRIKG